MTKQILFLSPFFFPEPISTGKYNEKVVEKMLESGAKVTVVCSHPIYPEWKVSLSGEGIKGVDIRRGGAWVRYPNNALIRRAVLEIWFSFHVISEMISVRRHSEIIVVFPPSLFMLFLVMFKAKSTKITGIVHDLQGVYAEKNKGFLLGLISRAIKFVESRAFLGCAKLIFLSETMQNVSINKYNLDVTRVKTHYPFVTIGERNEVLRSRLDHFFLPNLKSIVYSGALGEKQSPDELILFFTAVLDLYPDWQALVFSQGPIFNELQSRILHDRLKFYPLVDSDLLPSLLHRSDIQVVPQASGTSDGSLPSKLPNIIASGTRLLCITDHGSELELIVNQYPAGVVSNLWGIDVLLDKFRQLVVVPRATQDAIQGLKRKFSLDALVEELMED